MERRYNNKFCNVWSKHSLNLAIFFRHLQKLKIPLVFWKNHISYRVFCGFFFPLLFWSAGVCNTTKFLQTKEGLCYWEEVLFVLIAQNWDPLLLLHFKLKSLSFQNFKFKICTARCTVKAHRTVYIRKLLKSQTNL